MANKRHKPEEIVQKLRQVDVLVGQGMARVDAVRGGSHHGADLLPLAQAVWWDGNRPTEGTQASPEGERAAEKGRVGSDTGQAHPEGSRTGKLLSPARRRACIQLIRSGMKVSERRICRVLGQHRSTQRHHPRGREDEERLV